MDISRISIGKLTLFNFLGIGILSVILSVVAGRAFHDAAMDEQRQLVTRVVDVAAHQILQRLHEEGQDLGATAQKGREIRRLAAGKAGGDQSAAVAELDDQFHQRYVTSGRLVLRKLRLYDKALQPVIQSSEGDADLALGLPPFLLDQARDRKGAERMKVLGGLWLSEAGPAYSVLVPVGGLRLVGYLEVVLDPVHDLQQVAEVLKTPLSIGVVDGNSLYYRSDDWPTEGMSGDLAEVVHKLEGADGKPVVNLAVMEDVSDMNAVFQKAQWANTAGVAVGVGLVILFALLVFQRFLFGPMRRLVEDLGRVAEGNLSVHGDYRGLREVATLGQALSAMVARLREQVASIQQHSTELSSAAEEMSFITTDARAAVERQRNETDQVATAVNEMAATVQEVARNALEASESANQADDKSRQGKQVVGETVDRIGRLAAEVEEAATVIQKLEEKSEGVTRVMDVIRGIAEQTNLLALNAAIEAARAGEQGRGFAVVADEVRTLASRTQESTQEIQDLIAHLQEEASRAAEVMLQARGQAQETIEHAAAAGKALEDIKGATEVISNVNVQIATAAEQQAQVAEEINRSVVRIKDVADQSANGAEQTAQASESLSQLAVQLQSVAAQFRV